MKKYAYIMGAVFCIVAATIIALCTIYNYNIGPVSKSDNLKEIVINEGETFNSIGSLLKENNLIKSEFFYKLYIKINKPKTFEAGTYKLSENMGVKKIVETISKGSDVGDSIIKITFIEGKNMRWIAKKIADNTANSEEDVFMLLQNEKYIDSLIEKYWFLTNEIKNEQIYYPLEGYLFPDTYEFLNRNVTVEEIFEKMLDNTQNKLESLKEEIDASDLSVHEILTLASVIELEVGNATDRNKVAGVFYNRLNTSWETLGSDVTTYYGVKEDDWSGLTKEQLASCNGYNTRLESTCAVTGLPVGPIGNPSLESIEATLNPEETDMYYFVADCNGVTYLTETETEHINLINKLRNEGNWCED